MLSSAARADWKEFIPRPLENGAFVDLFTAYERDNIKYGGRLESVDRHLRPREAHPVLGRLLLSSPLSPYHFSIAGALKQEDYESSVIDTPGWSNDTGLEYDVRLLFLPEHVYNVTVYAAQYEPLYKEQVATQHNAVETTQGGAFRYRKKPYFLHTGYGHQNIDSGLSSSDVQHFFLDGQYFKRFTNGNELSFNGAFNPSWFTASGGVDGNTYQYLLGNMINLQRVRLSSNLSRLESEQNGGFSQTFNGDQFSVYELLNVYFPWNFRSNLSYRYQDNNATIDEPGTLPDRKLSNTNNDVQLDVIHRLYESLDTTYTFLDSWRDYSGGDTTFVSNGVSLNYTKVIPWGRFMAGTNVARGVTDNTGQGNAADDPYVGIPVPGSFVLRQQNVDPTSIVIYLKSPLPPNQLIRLVENVDYVVIPVQNTFEIRVFNLPPEFVIPGTYDFLAIYSLESGDFKIQTDTYGANTSVELFDDLLTPYFSYIEVRTDVLSGEFPGIPLDSTTYTGGLLIHRGPVRLRGEYQDFQWDAAPYQSWRAEIQYAAAINATTSLFAAAYYLNKHYSSPSVDVYSNVTEYTEESETISASLQKQFLLRNLFLSGGGSYSHIDGLVNTNAYTGNGSLIWKVGRLDVTLGASAYGSDSSGSSTLSTKRDHELFYLKMRRRLF